MSSTAVATRPTSEHTDDLDLVAAVRAGDDRAFEHLYARYQRRICAYVRGMVHDHGRAEDITQDVFVSALRRMRETDREIVFKPWIYEIAKNACIDAFRRSRRTEEVSFDAHDAIGAGEQHRLADRRVTPDAAMDTKQTLEDLRGAFGGLSQTHHDILVMRELEGLSYREIGDRLGMSRASVESTLFRARRRLSEEYEELVSGKRCVRVQGIIAGAGAATVGARDQRKLARHISHCQPCRRQALVAGFDLTAPERSVAARVAAILPLPAFLKRRWEDDGGLFGSHAASSPITQWSAHVASSVDPGTAGGWSKAVFGAAAVALGSLGAGSAIEQRDVTPNLLDRSPIVRGLAGLDSGSVLGGLRSSVGGEDAGGEAKLGGSVSSAAPEGVGLTRVRAGGRERRSGRPSPSSSVSQDGATSKVSGAQGAGSGTTPGVGRPGARPRPRTPDLNDVTSTLGLTGSGSGSGGQGSGAGAGEGSGSEPVNTGPIRRVLEGVLGAGGGAVGGGGSQSGGGGATSGAGTGAGAAGSATGTVTGAAGQATQSAGAATTAAPPDIVGQTVGALNTTVNSILPPG